MVNLLPSYTGRRRKLRIILLFFILASTSWATIFVLIQYKEKPPRRDIRNDTNESKNPWTNASFIPSAESPFYVAAVIDYETALRGDVISTLKANIQCFVDIIAECGKLMVDIVVFPEGGLHGYLPMGRQTALLSSFYVPSADNLIIPCGHKDYEENPLRYFSCAAKTNKIYVAVNLIEKVFSLRSYTDLLYVSEVVFDRNGMVIAKYRKFNLYTEKWGYEISTTDEPEIITFTTDFGVEFGIFVCFDIFFQKPALELVQKRNISHFIHSSQMMNRLPFLVASSVDFGWSHALDVVVLASSSPNPKYTIGTDIHFGRRQGTQTYAKSFRTSTIIIAPVPKYRDLTISQYPDEFNSLKKYTPSPFRPMSFLIEHVNARMTTKPLFTGNSPSSTFIYKSATFECQINASWELQGFAPNYHFIAYSGLNNYSVASINNYAENCGIALCSRNSYSFCQQPPRFDDASWLTFLSINISTRSSVSDSIRIPAAFDSNLVALDGSYFEFSSIALDNNGQMINYVDMRLRRPKVNLQAFSVYKFGTKPTPMNYFSIYDNLMNLDMI